MIREKILVAWYRSSPLSLIVFLESIDLLLFALPYYREYTISLATIRERLKKIQSQKDSSYDVFLTFVFYFNRILILLSATFITVHYSQM